MEQSDERQGADVDRVESTLDERLPRVSTQGARMSSNVVLQLRSKKCREDIESLEDVIDCWWRLDTFLEKVIGCHLD